MKKDAFTIIFSEVPGSTPVAQIRAKSLKTARELAKTLTWHRLDFVRADVRIEKNNKFIEYAGPVR